MMIFIMMNFLTAAAGTTSAGDLSSVLTPSSESSALVSGKCIHACSLLNSVYHSVSLRNNYLFFKESKQIVTYMQHNQQ